MEKKSLTILHFNDAYQIEKFENEPVGGVDRFKTVIDSFSSEDPLIIFSGDSLGPSRYLHFTKGMHMIEAMNKLPVSASCIGNHEFDLELDDLKKMHF